MNRSLGMLCSILLAASTGASAADGMSSPDRSMAYATATSAGARCDDDPSLSPLQRRLLQKYDRGLNVLLGFVTITRNIYLLDRAQTAAWAEAYRRAHPPCENVAAAPTE